MVSRSWMAPKGMTWPGERGAVQIVHHGFFHAFVALHKRNQRHARPLVLEQGRDVQAGNFGQGVQQRPLVHSLGLGPLHGGQELDHGLLAVADDHGVEERSHGFGVEGSTAARHDERQHGFPVRAAEGNARQVEHVQDIGVAQLVGQAESDDVHVRERRVRLQGGQGNTVLAQDGPGLLVGREDPLGPEIRLRVERLGQYLLAEVGHAHLVHVGKGQGAPHGHGGRVLEHGAPFAAEVARRAGEDGQQFFHDLEWFGGRKNGVGCSEPAPSEIAGFAWIG
jgi:hypothetical protein